MIDLIKSMGFVDKGATVGAGVGGFDRFFQASWHGDTVGWIGEDAVYHFRFAHIHIRIEGASWRKASLFDLRRFFIHHDRLP